MRLRHMRRRPCGCDHAVDIALIYLRGSWRLKRYMLIISARPSAAGELAARATTAGRVTAAPFAATACALGSGGNGQLDHCRETNRLEELQLL